MLIRLVCLLLHVSALGSCASCLENAVEMRGALPLDDCRKFVAGLRSKSDLDEFLESNRDAVVLFLRGDEETVSEFRAAACLMNRSVAFAQVEAADLDEEPRPRIIGFEARKCFHYDGAITSGALVDWVRATFQPDHPFKRHKRQKPRDEHEHDLPHSQNKAEVDDSLPTSQSMGNDPLRAQENKVSNDSQAQTEAEHEDAVDESLAVPQNKTEAEGTEPIEVAKESEVMKEAELTKEPEVSKEVDEISQNRTAVEESTVVVDELSVISQNKTEEAEENREAVRHVRHPPPVGLDEYKKKSFLEMKEASRTVEEIENATTEGQLQHRLEVDGREYNYAASSHGAKVLSANKEAKGASNILDKDPEKYLRNPCSAEDKFVVIELSEETLVDSIVIGNYEFYAANLKEFELLGSLKYPTEDWKFLAKFEAENARHAQNFTLPKPDWVKYLKVKMVSHHGTEFFCTLSTIQVYGVDAIERMLEGWIGKNSEESPPTTSTGAATPSTQRVNETSSGVSEKVVEKNLSKSTDALIQGSRSNTDSVIKILMQKVKALEMDQALFEKYLEALSADYKVLFTDMDRDLDALTERLQGLTKGLGALTSNVRTMEEQWKSETRELAEKLAAHTEAEAEALKLQRERIKQMENRELVALSLALFILVTSVAWHLVRCVVSVCTSRIPFLNSDKSSSFCCMLLFAVSLFFVVILSA